MIFGMAHPVMAQDFVLPVTQTMDVSGGKAASAGDISVTYTLTAEDGAPMPDGATIILYCARNRMTLPLKSFACS